MVCRIVILFLLLPLAVLFSSNFKEDKANIDSLVKAADAVVLSKNQVMKISEDEYCCDVSIKILIKNKKADDRCRVILTQSDFVKIEDIEAVLRDTLGAEIKELDSGDIREIEISPGSVFYSGDKYKIFELTHHSYPFVFEYSYHLSLSSLFFWPDWHPQTDIPTLYSSYKLITETPVSFKYKPIGMDNDQVKNVAGSDTVYFWEMEKIPQLKNEDYLPPENYTQKAILFAPDEFQIDEFQGSFKSWNELGQWSNKLYEGKFELPQKAKEEVLNLVSGISDEKEKVSTLFKFMQNRSRYVAVETGINGWMPRPAASVYENKYGDCKDLSTCMVAMLKTAGINCYPAHALTRNSGIVFTDFPSNQFNHVIVFVPLEKDTVWLECTNPYLDMNDIPASIENINVLVIKPTGGEIIQTPKKNADQNKWQAEFNGILDKEGNLNFSAAVLLSGNQKNFFKQELAENNNKDDMIFLHRYFGRNYPTLNLNSFAEENSSGANMDYMIKLNGVYNKFVTVNGSRLFINPNIFNKETDDDLPEQKPSERKFPVYTRFPYVDIDSVIIEIPKGFVLESIPKNLELNTEFIKYSAEYGFAENKIQFTRKIERSENIIPIERYKEYYEFMKMVIKSEDSKYILKKEN